MKKSNANPFHEFMAPAPEQAEAKKPEPVAKQIETEKPAEAAPIEKKRGPGRPPKAVKELTQPTTIRLDPDDHMSVRQLALRDRQTMNELIFVALRAYCDTRGVKLTGKVS